MGNEQYIPAFTAQSAQPPWASMGTSWGSPQSQFPLQDQNSMMGITPYGSDVTQANNFGMGITQPPTGDFMDMFNKQNMIPGLNAGKIPGFNPQGSGGWMDNFLGSPGQPGWGGMAVGAASGLMQGFLGMKQYGIAKKTLEENKRQFGLNYEAQRSTTNAQLNDRQRARVASNPTAYESPSDYMDKYGIKGGS